MFLLKLLLPHVSQAVLRSKFVDTMDVFSNVLNGGGQGAGSITNPLVRHLIECIGMVLAAQQCAPTFWAQPKTLQSFNAILNLIVDERPKIRKKLPRGHTHAFAWRARQVFGEQHRIVPGATAKVGIAEEYQACPCHFTVGARRFTVLAGQSRGKGW